MRGVLPAVGFLLLCHAQTLWEHCHQIYLLLSGLSDLTLV